MDIRAGEIMVERRGLVTGNKRGHVTNTAAMAIAAAGNGVRPACPSFWQPSYLRGLKGTTGDAF
jgi:hypothetical protein